MRLDGGLTDSNVVLRYGREKREWRVGTAGGRHRVDSWNIKQHIEEATTGARRGTGFSDQVQAVYEQGINQQMPGWVVLSLKQGKITGATHRQSV